jgi:hypothetical protein
MWLGIEPAADPPAVAESPKRTIYEESVAGTAAFASSVIAKAARKTESDAATGQSIL